MLPVGRGCDLEGYLEIMDCLLFFALGSVYIAKNTMKVTDQMDFAFLWEEIDRAEYGFFCGVKLLV